jgi:diaminopimelate epimerase
MQAVGNDFVVLEAEAWPPDTDWSGQALKLCDRKFGIGGDGLLVLDRSSVADVRMRMFNPDGSEDMCGNGLRCIALLAQARGLLKAGTVETFDGIRAVFVDTRSRPASIVAEMAVPLFAPRDLPALVPDSRENLLDYPLEIDGYGTQIVSTVNTGSTHTIAWVDELPGDDVFFTASPLIELNPVFPERSSVLWAKVLNDGRQGTGAHLQIRIWERGAGETLGCGTGACAAAILAIVQERVSGGSVAVRSKGGTLHILSRGVDTPLQMTGPAEIVYTGTVSL